MVVGEDKCHTGRVAVLLSLMDPPDRALCVCGYYQYPDTGYYLVLAKWVSTVWVPSG